MSTSALSASLPAKSESTALITIAVMAATIMQTLDTTIANVALPHMQGSLSAAQDQITWVLTSYIVASAIATAPTGYLAARFGRKQVFITSVLCFTVFSMLCGMATTLSQLVGFRILQGLFGAALVPLSQTVLLDTYPREKHGAAMAMWGVGVMIGPILGPTLGGWLTDNFSWRWVFYINLPIGLLAALALSASMPATRSERTTHLDAMGFIFLSLAIGSLQLMLDRGETKDWFSSTEILAEAGIGVLAIYLFVTHTLTTDKPFLPPRLFRDRNFVAGILMICVVGIVLLSTSALLPPFLQNLKGYPVTLIGLVTAPRGFGTMFAMIVGGRLMKTFDARLLIVAGLLCISASLQWMSHFNLDVSASAIVWSGVFQGLGLGLAFVALSALSFSSLDARDRADAAALFSLVRNIGASIGVALCFAFLSRSTQSAHAMLVEHVNPFNPALSQYLNATGGLASTAALAMIDTEVQRQAATLALLDDYRHLAIAVLLASPLALLFRKPLRAKAEEEAVTAFE